jgi:large subunit ribosomal protein L18
MKAIKNKLARRMRRKRRVRKRVTGHPDRPRLTVFRSNQNIYAQIVDDSAGRTLVAASSLEQALRAQLSAGGGNRKAAEVVGEQIASKAVEAGIKRVVFDRNGYPYHGRVRQLAEAARKGGLEF